MDPILELPFDVYQRHRLAAQLLGRLRRGRKPLSVLDVGAGAALLGRFVPKDRVVALDLVAQDTTDVRGDGAALPFLDGSFDVVVACDTLQDVPRARRATLMGECARVARRHLILIGPLASVHVTRARRLFDDYRGGGKSASHPLPKRAEVEARLVKLGAVVASLGHGNVHRWLAHVCADLHLDADAVREPVAARFHAFYNAQFFDGDCEAPVYRHALIAALHAAPLPELSDFATPRAVPDALPAEWDVERLRLVDQNAELSVRVDAQRAELERCGGALFGAQQAIEALGRAELEKRQALFAEQAGRAEDRARLLARARALEVERTELRADLARVRAERNGLEAALDGLAEAVERLDVCAAPAGADESAAAAPLEDPVSELPGPSNLVEARAEIGRLADEIAELRCALGELGLLEATLVHLDSPSPGSGPPA